MGGLTGSQGGRSAKAAGPAVLAQDLPTGTPAPRLCGLLAFRPSISRRLNGRRDTITVTGVVSRLSAALVQWAERRKGRIMWYSIVYLGVLSLLLAAVYEGAVRRQRHR